MDIKSIEGKILLSIDGDTLSDADLSGADLKGAILNYADLSDADLSGVKEDIVKIHAST